MKYGEIHKLLHLFGFYHGESNDDYIIPNIAFYWLCGNGYLFHAKRLYSLGDLIIDEMMYDIFKKCCENGNLDVAKWLLYTFDIKNKFPSLLIEKCCHEEEMG